MSLPSRPSAVKPLTHTHPPSKIVLTLKEDLEGGRVGTVVGDDDTRAADDLAGLALTVNLGETGPLSEDLGVRHLDELDVVLGAQSLDELEVLGCMSVMCRAKFQNSSLRRF